ncbi:MAG: C40 family peptidase [Sulfuriferula sp.]
MTPGTLAAIKAHAEAEFPRECCGLVSIRRGREIYTPCGNLAKDADHFVMDPEDYARVEEAGAVTAIAHSHCYVPATPSEADLVGCESSGVPWIIYALPTHQVHTFEPSGYKAPLIGREFHHGSLDCYSLVRDYYREEAGIELPDYPRDVEWWLHGANLYLENFTQAGFVQVDPSDPKKHDGILMKIASPVPNHAAVHVGDGVIIQHLAGRLSSRDMYGGWFSKVTTHVLRHKSLC